MPPRAGLTWGGSIRKTPAMLDPRSVRQLPALVRSRLLSGAVAGALLVAAMPAQASLAPSAAEIERQYTEADKKNAEGDFKGAAELWTRLMVLVPEENANQSTRETLLLNVLDAHINAYNRLPTPEGKKDISHLQEGKKTFELYLQQYRAVYGSGRAISLAVQQKSDELNGLLTKAEEDAKGATVTPPDPAVKPGPGEKPITEPPPPKLPPENNGTGLIVGGAVTAALGFGAVGVLIAGAVGAPRAEEDYEVAQSGGLGLCGTFPDTKCADLDATQGDQYDEYKSDLEDADQRGKVANALTITGAILTPVLLGAGAAMLAIGIKRNRASRVAAQASLAPAMSPTFAGAVLRGRF